MTAPLVDSSVLESLEFEPKCEIATHNSGDEGAKWLIESDHWNQIYYKEHSSVRLSCDTCKKKIEEEDKANQKRRGNCPQCGLYLKSAIKNITSI